MKMLASRKTSLPWGKLGKTSAGTLHILDVRLLCRPLPSVTVYNKAWSGRIQRLQSHCNSLLSTFPSEVTLLETYQSCPTSKPRVNERARWHLPLVGHDNR